MQGIAPIYSWPYRVVVFLKFYESLCREVWGVHINVFPLCVLVYDGSIVSYSLRDLFCLPNNVDRN
jgi:hypothetical protein